MMQDYGLKESHIILTDSTWYGMKFPEWLHCTP